MNGSGLVKSSFNQRRRKQAFDNAGGNADAIQRNTSSNEEEASLDLLGSESGSDQSEVLISSNNQSVLNKENDSNNERSGQSSYRSNTDSHEPKTPDDNDEIQDSQTFNMSNFGSEDMESIQNPSELLLYEPNIDFVDNDNKSFNNWDQMSINDNIPDYPFNGYSRYQPPSGDTLGLDRDEDLEDSLIANLTIDRRYPHYSQDPLSFLMSQEKSISSHLQKNIKSHSEISKKGLSSKYVRHQSENYLKSLASIYQSIVELYEKELKRKSIILSSFERWEQDKNRITNKVKEIRSDKNQEGHRLKQLIEESSIVDDEIDQLEKRLKQLKEKKNVLKNEITQSQSIIESRSSSYLESLRKIENVEREAIMRLSQECSIESGLSNSSLGFPIGANNKKTQTFGLKSFLMKFSSDSSHSYDEIDAGPVIEMLQRQVASFKDCIESFNSKKINFEEASIIWENVTSVLNSLEVKISTILQNQSKNNESIDQSKGKIIEHLTQTQDLLIERLDSIKNMNESLKDLILTEISVLDMGINMIDPGARKPLPQTTELDTKSKSGSPHAINPTIAKFSISEKALASSPPHATLAVGSGSFNSSNSGSLKSQLRNGLKKDATNIVKNDKLTKRD